MVNFEVKQVYAVLGSKKDRSGKPCDVKLTRTVWGNSRPMWDLRLWSDDGKPLKGITLTGGMIRNLKAALDGMELSDETN